MRYKQEQKGSPYYYREGDHWCETLTTWLEKDPEGEFIGKDGDNPTSPPYKNTISLNTSGAGRNQAQNGTTSGQLRDNFGATWGEYSNKFDEIMREAGTRQDKRLVAEAIGLKPSDDAFRKILLRRKDEGKIRPYRGSHYLIEWVNREYEVTKLGKVERQTMLDIKLPFGMHDIVCLPPRSVVGVAGVTSSGKTSYFLEVAELNVFTQPMPVYYWYMEMSEEKMQYRCEDFPLLIEAQAEGKFFPVKQNNFEFADVLEPNAINLTDYLDRNEEFYLIGDDIMQLYNRLHKGVVFFGLQKSPDSSSGYGGRQSVKLSNLYVTLDISLQDDKAVNGIATILKAKDWRDDDRNPVGLKCRYKTGGKHGKLFIDGEWKRW